ncbi:hypothetical protein ABNF97_30725 [Plantactinospora sp. B6F1]|uniref:hypothetical protein n=1 Tax=Plantactinospora sp. B6F1 TaxID=3158971 RepID=UPI0032D9989D
MEAIYGLPPGDRRSSFASPISVASAAPGDPRRVDSAPIARFRVRLVDGPPSIPHSADGLLAVGTTSLVPLNSDLADRTL